MERAEQKMWGAKGGEKEESPREDLKELSFGIAENRSEEWSERARVCSRSVPYLQLLRLLKTRMMPKVLLVIGQSPLRSDSCEHKDIERPFFTALDM